MTIRDLVKKYPLGFVLTLLLIICNVLIMKNLIFAKNDAMTSYREQFKKYQDSVVTPTLLLSDSLKNEVDSLVKIADSVKEQSDSLTTKIYSMQKNNKILRVRNKKLSDSLKTITLPEECNPCIKLVSSLEEEVDSLQSTVNKMEIRDSSRLVEIGSLRHGITLQTQRADSLQSVIINFPPPPKPKTFIGLHINNKTTFIAGLVLGGVAVGAIK